MSLKCTDNHFHLEFTPTSFLVMKNISTPGPTSDTGSWIRSSSPKLRTKPSIKANCSYPRPINDARGRMHRASLMGLGYEQFALMLGFVLSFGLEDRIQDPVSLVGPGVLMFFITRKDVGVNSR